MNEENVVFIGKKSTMVYVMAVIMRMNRGAKEITLKARGKAISRAVDVAEIVKNRLPNEVKIGDINIYTEHIKADEENDLKVSAIEIPLKK